MEKHIKEYLLQNKNLKISDFGIFEIVYKPSEIHPILHTFTVPGNYVVFKEDTVIEGDEFVDFVSKCENLTKEEAGNRINHWVGEIRETIASKKEYSLSTLGKFVLNAMNKIEFIPSLDTDISPESLGLEDFTAKIPAVVKKEIKPEIIEKKIEKEKNKEEIEIVPPIASQKETAIENTEKAEDISEQKADNKQDAAPSEKEIEDESITKKPKKRRRPVLVLLMTLLALAVCSTLIVGIAYYFYPEKLQNHCGTFYAFIDEKANASNGKSKDIETEEVVVVEKSSDEEIAIMDDQYIQPELGYTEEISNGETEIVEEKPVENIVAEEKPTAIQSGSYYVIIGSFKENANAEAFLVKKQSEYSNVINLGLGKSSQLYMIGIGPYSQEEAKQQINNGVKGWLLKK